MSLVISHNFGFFSCSTMRLHYLIDYFHENKALPVIFDSRDCYGWYKPDNNSSIDITFNYFKHYDEIPETIEYKRRINYKEWFQFKSYNQLDYENICVLFFRGNDKATEVELPSYEEYIHYGKYVLNLYPNIKFLIQSDETEFLITMANHFPNHIISVSYTHLTLPTT